MAALSEKTMAHPDFDRLANTANDALLSATERAGFSVSDLAKFDTQAGRIVDDLTMLLMRLNKR